MIYLIGSLRNPEVPKVARRLRAEGFEVYDEWFCPGPETDEWWQKYCRDRGLSYVEAMEGWHAKQVFEIDKFHLDRCEAAILLLPAGKSGHLEMGYIVGSKKRAFILLDKEPDRYDLMYRFVEKVTDSLDEIVHRLRQPDIESPAREAMRQLYLPFESPGQWSLEQTESPCLSGCGTEIPTSTSRIPSMASA